MLNLSLRWLPFEGTIELVRRDDYIAPPGNQVGLDFGGAYTPPQGNQVALEFVPSDEDSGGDDQYLFPEGSDHSVFGTAEFKLQVRYLLPGGIASTLTFGAASLHNYDTYVRPSGFNASAFGTASLRNLNRYYQLVGWQSSRFGVSGVFNWNPDVFPFGWVSSETGTNHSVWNLTQISSAIGWASSNVPAPNRVWNRNQTTSPGGIPHPPQTGPNEFRQLPSPWVSELNRTLSLSGRSIGVPSNQVPSGARISSEYQYVLLQNRGFLSSRYGSPQASFKDREIRPPSLAPPAVPIPKAGIIRDIDLQGWESSFVPPGARVDINLQRLYHHSGVGDPAQYGETFFRNEFEQLYPSGWATTEFGFQTVYNFDQELLVGAYMGTNDDPTQWPNWAPFVENRTRYIGPTGWVSARFSVFPAYVWNKAVPVFVQGWDSNEYGADTSATHGIRFVEPPGWDSYYSTHYTIVYNGATVYGFQGWESSEVGRPGQVLNLNRTVQHHSGPTGATFGTAYSDFGVREIGPTLFSRVPASFHEVRYNPYPVEPEGLDSYRTGGHYLQEIFRILYAWPANVHSVPPIGEPIVTSTNREVRPRQVVDDGYGLPRVFNSNQEVQVSPYEPLWWGFGLHNIADRNRAISPPATSPGRVSSGAWVYNVWPDPPRPRYLRPGSLYIGSADRPGIVPTPVLNVRTIRALPIAPGQFGTPETWSSNIEVEPFRQTSVVGTPFIPHSRGIWARPYPPTGGGSSDRTFQGRRVARFSPHNIYAPSGDQASQQYLINNPVSDRHAIDRYVLDTSQWGRGFGRPWVSNQHRVLRNVGGLNVRRFGTPNLFLDAPRYLYPRGFRTERWGRVLFMDVPQYIGFEWYGGWRSSELGHPRASRPPAPPSPPRPSGWVSSRYGTQRIELFHRTVFPAAIPHRGNPQLGDTSPWGRPMMGFERMYTLTGWRSDVWGTTWVSHHTRTVSPESWDSSVAEAEFPSWFRERGRVTLRNPPGGVPGIPSTIEFGETSVTHGIRGVLGRGINSYNAGTPDVRAEAYILPNGWTSHEFGDIDRWEENLVKPHGDDMSLVGTPRARHRVIPEGVAPETTVGDARVGSVLYPLGVPDIGFDGPSVSNPFGCTNRVLSVFPVLSQQTVPEPMVTSV